jgi:ABC-type branched-subunit amino acid transport system substrate-binding protein
MSLRVKMTVVGALAMVAALAPACGSSSHSASSTTVASSGGSATTASVGSATTASGAGNTASAPGVSASKVTVGLVTSVSGVESAQFNGAQQGAQARIDLQNDQGGVNGRQLELVTGDDQSSPSGASTAVADLISQKHVFGLMFVSGVTATAYKLPQQQGIPVVGAAVDGPEWGVQPNTNMFSVEGNEGPTGLTVSTELPNLMKLEGATSIASLGNGDEPASAEAAKAFTSGAKTDGLNVAYENYSIPLGSVDMTSVALAMKSKNIDGFYAPMIETTLFALLSALQNENAPQKAAVLATGYGQEIFSQPSAVRAAQNAIFDVLQLPVEEKTPATLAEQAAFAKYEHYTGIPNLNWSFGWLSADLMIRGLQVAGQNPTRSSFISALHNVSDWNGGGLLPTNVDLSLANFGKFAPTSCAYFVRLVGQAFVPLNNGKAVCGNNIT